jgi:hypothetical protein
MYKFRNYIPIRSGPVLWSTYGLALHNRAAGVSISSGTMHENAMHGTYFVTYTY